MGIAIKLTDSDFSENNLGQVTFLAGPIQGLSISGSASIASNETSAQYSVVYNPTNTEENGVTWSIVSDTGNIASISENGVLTVATNRSTGTVVIRATSIFNNAIYDEKEISVAEHVSFYTAHNITSNEIKTGTWGPGFTLYSLNHMYYNMSYTWRHNVDGSYYLTSIDDNKYTITVAPGYKVKICYASHDGDLTTATKTNSWIGSDTNETVINLSDYLTDSDGGGFSLCMAKYGESLSDLSVLFDLNRDNIENYFKIEHVETESE